MKDFLQKYLINRYTITILIFAIIYLFVGDQSICNYIRHQRQINSLKEQRDEYQKEIQQAEHRLKILQNKDSLEKFARETYYMHRADEKVFVIDE